MAIRVPNGLVLSIASAFGTQFNITAITNANPAVGTHGASHGVVVNDIVELTSGWDGLDGRIARASVVATNDVTYEGVDTSNTQQYPAGGGTGTGREISTWTPLSQIQSVGRSGGEQQYADATLLSDLVFGRQIPTIRSPISMTITVMEDPALSWLPTVRSAAASRARTPFRISYPGAGFLYGNAVWSLLEVPTMEANSPMTVTIDLALVSQPTRYAT